MFTFRQILGRAVPSGGRALPLAALAVLLSACGQKGPLYLPPAATTAAPAATAPITPAPANAATAPR